MKRGLRWFLFSLIALAVIIAGVVIFAYRAIHHSLPLTRGELAAPGLTAAVSISRDAFGVPHIVSTNEADLMFAAGFTQAQDRLWQMDFLRRVASGKLSELFGTKTLQADKALRTIGFMRISKMIEDSLAPVTHALLQSYADGVNYYITTHKGDYPVEFTLLDFAPEPWKVEHSIALSRLLGWQLCMGWYVDVSYDKILDSVGFTKLQEILPRYPSDAPVILSKVPEAMAKNLPAIGRSVTEAHYRENDFEKIGASNSLAMTAFEQANVQVRGLLGFEGFGVGSNNWVVTGAHSESGKPILANDPHLGHNAPGIWYEMQLTGGRFNVTGMTMPGVPLIILGNNSRIAWGFTNVMLDDADFYKERVQDSMYFFNGAWRKLQFKDEKIVIKDSTDVTLRVALTHRGPIINEAFREISGGSAVSVRWTGYELTREVEGILKLNLASDWNSFRAAAGEFRVPAQNVVYADVDGNIGYQCMGLIPIRRSGNGIGLLDGTQLQSDWAGFLPFDQQPYVLNPEEGFIASANNKTAGDWYSVFIGNYWEHASRIQRIREFLTSKEKFSIGDFKELQNDFLSPHAREVVPYILDACAKDSVFTAQDLDGEANYQYNEAYLFLKHWDFRMDRTSRGAVIFNTFFQKLLAHTYKDEMGGELFESFIRLTNIPTRATSQILKNKLSPWWDDIHTKPIEDRDAVIRETMRETVEELVRRLGKEPGQWTWERVHSVTFGHVIGQQKPLDYLFNIGPFPIGGNSTTVNNTEYHYSDEKFRTTLGPSMRRIVDLSNIEHAFTTTTLGQSGQPFSDHYQDQVHQWLDGRYKMVTMNRSELEKDAAVLILKPKP